jgi:1-aminocyclopropane-1-carboxylate deaminase/D-cysteine desulfhydrase-like pyridoxal-dependent ACC family enzyme
MGRDERVEKKKKMGRDERLEKEEEENDERLEIERFLQIYIYIKKPDLSPFLFTGNKFGF